MSDIHTPAVIHTLMRCMQYINMPLPLQHSIYILLCKYTVYKQDQNASSDTYIIQKSHTSCMTRWACSDGCSARQITKYMSIPLLVFKECNSMSHASANYMISPLRQEVLLSLGNVEEIICQSCIKPQDITSILDITPLTDCKHPYYTSFDASTSHGYGHYLSVAVCGVHTLRLNSVLSIVVPIRVNLPSCVIYFLYVISISYIIMYYSL